MNTQSDRGSNIQDIKSKWWLFEILGVVLILMGITAILIFSIAVTAAQIALGIILLLGGIIYGAYSFGSRRESGFVESLLLAFLFFAAGVLVLARPTAGLSLIRFIFGILFPVQGILLIVSAWRLRSLWSWGWGLFSGVISILLGVAIWMNWSWTTGWGVGLLLGIDLMVSGLAILIFGMQVHRVSQVSGTGLNTRQLTGQEQ